MKMFSVPFFLFVTGVCLGAAGGGAPEPVPEDDFQKIMIRPASQSRWKAKSLSVTGEKIPAEEDFFVEEFGRPCVFTEDWILKEGSADGPYTVEDGRLRFTTGEKGFTFLFGPKMLSRERPALNIGFGWGRIKHAQVELSMELEQDADKTEWTVIPYQFRYPMQTRKAVVEGRGKKTLTVKFGPVWNFFRDAPIGISIQCGTPGAKIAVSSVSIRPYAYSGCFRGSFELEEKPLFAQASFRLAGVHEMYVNGVKVSEGNRNHGLGDHAHIHLTEYLRKGRNTIAFRRENDTYGGTDLPFHLEGMAFDRRGRITRFLTDSSWRAAPGVPSGWEKSDFDDSAWSPARAVSGIGLVPTGNGSSAFDGLNPRHMGVLQPEPEGEKYPLFDYDRPVFYRLPLPDGLPSGTTAEAEVLSWPDGKKLADAHPLPEAPERKEGWIIRRFEIPKQKPGPYKLRWKLLAGGKLLEENRTDMIIVGPVEQEVCRPEELEGKFKADLELVYSIDCTKAEKSSADFIDHTGFYVTDRKLDSGRITRKNDMTYRETGPQAWDYFGYRINLFRYRGEVLAVEVDIPDNEPRDVPVVIYESYPVGFTNNGRKGETAHAVASGTLRTGLDIPLSGKMRTLRFLYWPGSALAGIHVGTWYQGYRGAASAIRFYRLKSGRLPFAKGGMERLIGPHCERITNIADTLVRTFDTQMSDRRVFVNAPDDAYCILYRMYEEKIRFLRFLGQNYTTEGVYMYIGGNYPSLRHSAVGSSNEDADPLLLGLKMYRFNDIRCDLGVEYMSSPAEHSTVRHFSDRKIRLGEGSATHMLDRYGRQIITQSAGINFLNAEERAVMTDCVREIAERYGREPAVDGFLLVAGTWWAPAWMNGVFRDVTDKEVGYDDDTVGLFEKDHSVDLGISPRDPDRFDKRCRKLLSPEYRERWLAWRNLQLKKCFETLAGAVRPSPLYVFPSGLFEKDNPFTSATSTGAERESYVEKRYLETGLPLSLYSPGDAVKPMAAVHYLTGRETPDKNWLAEKGKNGSASMLDVIRKSGQVFCSPPGLEELSLPTDLNRKWFCRGTAAANTLSRPPGEYAMTDYVNYLASTTPKKFVTTWTDCNLDTCVNPAIAKFSLAYRAIPDLPFAEFSGFKGGSAMTAFDGKDTWLKLVNNTFHPVKGRLSGRASGVTDVLSGRGALLLPLEFEMDAESVALFRIPGRADGLSGVLRLPPDAEKETRKEAEVVLKSQTDIPPETLAKLSSALKAEDVQTCRVILDSYEVRRSSDSIRKAVAGTRFQEMLLEDLAKSRARINCAFDKVYLAPNGDRWLPDQHYYGPAAYGNENANFADRGDLKIEGSDLQRVYSTEAFGVVVRYYVPLPAGKYHVYLHFAETFPGNKAPGRRRILVEVQGKRQEKAVDPFADAGGFAKPYVLKIPDVDVGNGLLAIRLINDVGIEGIEIERAE